MILGFVRTAGYASPARNVSPEPTWRWSEMRAYKSAGVALVAAIVLALVAASAALGAAEFAPIPANKGFETRSGSSVLRADEESEKITCAASTSTGEITGAKTVGRVVVAFTGCTSAGIGGTGCAVESEGAKAGEVRTSVFKGEPGSAGFW